MKPAKEKKAKEKDRKHTKKRRREESGVDGLKLLILAKLGDVAKVERYLAKHGSSSINSFDAEGFTPLHQACSDGNNEMADLLLAHGADVQAEDFKGNTPVHIAASQGHILLLTKLLQVDRPPDIDARNADGVTIRELAATAACHASRESIKDAELDNVDEWARFLEDDGEAAGVEDGKEAWPPHDSEDEWTARLRQENDPDYDEWNWDSFGYGYPGGVQHPGEETEDEFAQRIWREMQRRKQPAAGPTAATQEAWGAADEAAKQRDARAREAEERSRKILDEEKAKDAAWRQAVKMGNVSALRAAYEARWHSFGQAVKAGGRNLTYAEMPWPAEGADAVRTVVLYGTSTPAEVKKRVRLELLRWHEDKFAKFKDRLVASDVERILERVKAVTQTLNSISMKL
ncbi:hypothetical protein CVIRNUC_006445 [Coccomyxa viridis]|uniref:NF-kappa-B inhibitor-like protein 1 n=1 Tax=Coccomyxa viridis TaxID=1274662 RepID=A0AAV1I971_9CHLO|nr:hypothetical protein CVIRNUC_006445 [Coccomyxa viridis]